MARMQMTQNVFSAPVVVASVFGVGLRALNMSHLRFDVRPPVLSSVAVRLVSHGHMHIENALPATLRQAKTIRARTRSAARADAWAYLHVKKSLLCHFKTLCWSHVLHLAQKRVHFLQKHVRTLI